MKQKVWIYIRPSLITSKNNDCNKLTVSSALDTEIQVSRTFRLSYRGLVAQIPQTSSRH